MMRNMLPAVLVALLFVGAALVLLLPDVDFSTAN